MSFWVERGLVVYFSRLTGPRGLFRTLTRTKWPVHGLTSQIAIHSAAPVVTIDERVLVQVQQVEMWHGLDSCSVRKEGGGG
jgi:hypothetical protein